MALASNPTAGATRIGADFGAPSGAGAALTARRAPLLPAPSRPLDRVLQTRHAPAQLSLWLRPGPGSR